MRLLTEVETRHVAGGLMAIDDDGGGGGGGWSAPSDASVTVDNSGPTPVITIHGSSLSDPGTLNLEQVQSDWYNDVFHDSMAHTMGTALAGVAAAALMGAAAVVLIPSLSVGVIAAGAVVLMAVLGSVLGSIFGHWKKGK